MENLTNTTEKSILLRIAKKLTAAQQELDELAVQLALGKAEATDKFEDIKKEFGVRLNELKQVIDASPEKEITTDLNAKMNVLEAQLSIGQAKTKDLFEAQMKKILAGMADVEIVMKTKFMNNPNVHDLVNELEKFKLKLEVLRLRFALKKFEVKDGFRSGMKEARKEINNLMAGAKNKLSKAKDTYTDFRDEIKEAYEHMRKAVKKI